MFTLRMGDEPFTWVLSTLDEEDHPLCGVIEGPLEGVLTFLQQKGIDLSQVKVED